MKWYEWQVLAENEDHWLDDVEPGLASVEHLHDHVLRLRFTDQPDDVAYELDFAPLLVDDNPGGVFEPLRNVNRFRNVEAEYALIWPDPVTGDAIHAVDLAPECVRFFCQRYGRTVDKAAIAVVA